MAVKTEKKEKSIEEKLITLKKLQSACSKIDALDNLMADLPLEIEDLEDEIAKMEHKVQELEAKNKEKNQLVAGEKAKIANSEGLISKYNEQLNGIKNNREYDNLKKEIEFHGFEIELAEKRTAEAKEEITQIKAKLGVIKDQIVDRKEVLKDRKANLEKHQEETEAEKNKILKTVTSLEKELDERLVKSFHRTRQGNKNGLAVVQVDRDACGGCFNKIPAQNQIDIKLHRKILSCEYCGRIILDADL